MPNIGYSVSFTTRRMREGEAEGKDYFFVSRREFESLIARGEFLEFAEVHGNLYGTSRAQVKRETSAGRDIILEIDVQGAASIRMAAAVAAVSVFILPPSFQILRERLILRGTERFEDLNLRLSNAFAEAERCQEFDYVIINEEIKKAAIDLQSVILAERLRREKQTETIENILKTFENLKTSSVTD